jgi:ubiquinol-cytochrome c reductase cytochrome c1 subunit
MSVAVRFGVRIATAAAITALIGLGAGVSVAQTQGPSQPGTVAPGTGAPQAAPAGQPPSAGEIRPAPATPQPPPIQVPSAAGHEAAGAAPSHFPLRLPAFHDWTFGGFFGTFDQAQLQRGYQVYKEVCANCHSMNLVAFRNLGEASGPAFPPEAVRALAASYMITDGPNDNGDMFQRPGRPSDYFQAPFANPQQAAASNGGAAPPDLSVIAKARAPDRGIQWAPVDFFTGYQEAGPDYIRALLAGYSDPPPGVEIPEGTYYNPYFLYGVSLKMPPPLMDGLVEYSDGTPATVEQYAADVSAFLMWAAEPHLVERKEIGFRVLIFLIVFAVFMYLSKRKVWSTVPH